MFSIPFPRARELREVIRQFSIYVFLFENSVCLFVCCTRHRDIFGTSSDATQIPHLFIVYYEGWAWTCSGKWASNFIWSPILFRWAQPLMLGLRWSIIKHWNMNCKILDVQSSVSLPKWRSPWIWLHVKMEDNNNTFIWIIKSCRNWPGQMT